MSKSGSSAGGRSGAGRKGRPGARPEAGGRGDRTHKTPSQHAELRRNAERSIHGPRDAVARAMKAAKSGNQARKVAHQARAIAKKKGKGNTKLGKAVKAAHKAVDRYGKALDRVAKAHAKHETAKRKTAAMKAAYRLRHGREFPG